MPNIRSKTKVRTPFPVFLIKGVIEQAISEKQQSKNTNTNYSNLSDTQIQTAVINKNNYNLLAKPSMLKRTVSVTYNDPAYNGWYINTWPSVYNDQYVPTTGPFPYTVTPTTNGIMTNSANVVSDTNYSVVLPSSANGVARQYIYKLYITGPIPGSSDGIPDPSMYTPDFTTMSCPTSWSPGSGYIGFPMIYQQITMGFYCWFFIQSTFFTDRGEYNTTSSDFYNILSLNAQYPTFNTFPFIGQNNVQYAYLASFEGVLNGQRVQGPEYYFPNPATIQVPPPCST
jgi:hypothetical protein